MAEELQEAIAQELYRQYRATGDDENDLPDWEGLEGVWFEEDEPDPKGWYRDRAAELLAGPLAALVADATVWRMLDGRSGYRIPEFKVELEDNEDDL